MAEWKYTKSLYNGGQQCDIWESEGLPDWQIVVFFERGRPPLLCNTKTRCSKQLHELSPELYSQYPHLCVADDVHDARLLKEQELATITSRLVQTAEEIEEDLAHLHPSNTPGWKRLPNYVREQAQWIRQTVDDMEEWADEVEKWLRYP